MTFCCCVSVFSRNFTVCQNVSCTLRRKLFVAMLFNVQTTYCFMRLCFLMHNAFVDIAAGFLPCYSASGNSLHSQLHHWAAFTHTGSCLEALRRIPDFVLPLHPGYASTGSLPSTWGNAGSFCNLQTLGLDGLSLTGTFSS